MSVFTPVAAHELAAFLAPYRLGELLGYRGIAEGIENSNFFVVTACGEYVFTVFESLSYTELGYYVELQAFLAERGLPCPRPLADRHGRRLQVFKGKPALLCERLPGVSVMRPEPTHCAAVGAALARLHLAGRGFPERRADPRGPRWWPQAMVRLLPQLDAEDAALLRAELAFQAALPRECLPQGVIHADLFRDNALFVDGALSGLVDFYYACHGPWLYDLAVAANDWCLDAAEALAPEHVAALFAGYQRLRPLRPEERTAWPGLLRAAALRFWLSRALDRLYPRDGELVHRRDPDLFKRLLRRYAEEGVGMSEVWL
ncbi:MAG TPA: homoserine kinase [Candidatus Competibacteraceae bacterium]|nr:homoserine kinase [Candidatus Competibacteraceae bacterium]